MPGTMSEADLVADLKASLMDSAGAFTAAADGDFKRHLKTAALAFCAKRPRTLLGEITLVAEQAEYTPPDDLWMFKTSLWGVAPKKRCMPWEDAWPGRLPDVQQVQVTGGAWKLMLTPPPASAQISALGAVFKFYYFGAHVVDASAANTTVKPGDRNLLMLRAQAEAMRELAMRNVTKPVVMREAMGSVPRNGTPSGLYAQLLDEFERAA